VLNLRITAYLSTPLAAYDNWSPSIDSLLEWMLLDKLGLVSPNPTPQQVEDSRTIVAANMPIAKGDLKGQWYWQVSSPCYTILAENQDRFRKRWEPGIDTPNPNWGKRKAKVDTSQGAEKSYDLPLPLRTVDRINWYAIGDVEGVQSLLEPCTSLGKKRSIGNGQISRWQTIPIEYDWHLWGKNGELMRPIPLECMPVDRPIDFAPLRWGWRPPSWLHTNKTNCAMPIHNVRRLTDAP